jgi:hypothetical protein
MNLLMWMAIGTLAVSTLSSTATAAPQANLGPEVINLKMGVMIAPFKHSKHQKLLNNECWHCHKTTKGKIDDWGKETAHTICIACHDLYEKGPIQCRECHKKSGGRRQAGG